MTARWLTTLVVWLASTACSHAQTVTWTGGGDGTSWGQAANWSSNPALPGAANDVVIPAGAQAINFNVVATIRSLSLDRAMNLGANCNNLTITNGITLPTSAGVLSTLQIGCNQVIFNGTQSITGAGEIAVAAGSMRVAGTSTLTVGSGVTVRNVSGVNGAITLDAGATLTNQGTIRASGQTFTISGANATSTLTNASGGSLASDSGGTLAISGVSWSNGGTLLVNAGTLNLGGTFAALGTVNRTAGVINISGSYTGATLALSAATGNITLSGGTYTGTTFTATGGAALSVSNAVTLSGATVATPISLTAEACNALTITNGLTLQGGATITTAQIGCAQLTFSGPPQSITGSGEIVGNAGSMRIVGTHALTIGPGVTLRNGASNTTLTLDAGASLINQGALRGTGSGVTFTISGPVTSTLTNTGTIEAINGGTLAISGLTWTNGGTIVVNTNGTANLGGTFAALGAISRSGGTINLSGSYTGATLALSASTGNITLSGGTYTGTSFTSTGGATLSVSNAVTLSGATVATPISLTAEACNALTITNGLTLQGGATITTAQIGCVQLSFTGPPQSITGSGEIVGNAGSMRIVGTHALTIGPGVTLRNGASNTTLTLDAGASLINQGALRGTGNGVTFTISGPVTSTLTNTGTVEAINGGTLAISGLTWTNGGTIVVNTNGTANLGGTLAALGTINRSGGTINLSGNYTGASLTLSNATGPINFSSMTFNGTTLNAIDGQSFSISNATTLSGVTLNAPLNLANTACESLTITNGLTLAGGATITTAQIGCNQILFSGPAQAIGGTGTIISNAGGLRIVGTHTLTVGSGITLRNGTFSTGFSIDTGGTLINQGTIRATGAGQTYTISGPVAGTLTNTGSLEAVNSGTLTVSGVTWANNGTLVVNTGGTINLGGTLAALGTINRSGGTINLSGNYTGASLTLSNATGPINFAGNITFTGTTLSAIDGQSFGISGGTTFNNVTLAAPLVLSNAICNALTVTNGLTLQGGATITTGQVGCVQLTFSGPSQSISGTGTIASNAGGLRVAGASTLTIGPGITLRTDAFSTSLALDDGATLVNQGTIRSSGAGRTYAIGGTASGPSSTLTNSGTIEALAGGVVSLQTDLVANNSGQMFIDPGSSLTILQTATLNLGPAGRVTFRIGGPGAANAGSVVVNTGGTLNMGGAVTVEYVNGYSPTGCQPAATLISGAGALGGQFGSAVVPPPPGSLRSAVGYSGNTVFFAFTSRADVAALGGAPTPDGQLTADDIIAYLNAFFSGNLAVADVAGLGGTPGADGQLTPDDIILFLDSFFAGCQ